MSPRSFSISEEQHRWGSEGPCFVYSLVSIGGRSLHVSKTQNSTYFLLPEALLAPCSQRMTSRRAWPLRCRRALTPLGRLGWGSRRRASPRGPGRRPWLAHSSPWTPRSKPFLQPPFPCPPARGPHCIPGCPRPPGVCTHQGLTCLPCAPPRCGRPQESPGHPSLQVGVCVWGVCVRVHMCGGGAVLASDPCSLCRPKKLRFHPKQLYFSARQGELQKVLLMLGRWAKTPLSLQGRPAVSHPVPLLWSAHTGCPWGSACLPCSCSVTVVGVVSWN